MVTIWQFNPLLIPTILMTLYYWIVASNLIGFLFEQPLLTFGCTTFAFLFGHNAMAKLVGQQHLSRLANHRLPHQGA